VISVLTILMPDKFNLFPEPYPSPCTKVCKFMLSADMCAGCGRTKEEITVWSTVNDDERKHIAKKAANRLQSSKFTIIS